MSNHTVVFPASWQLECWYFTSMNCLLVSPGKAHAQERRLVVRRDVMGDPDAVRSEAIRRADERASGGELQPLVPGWRPAEGGAKAAVVSAGDLRPDGRVLEAPGGGPAALLRDPPLPAAQEPRLRPRHRIKPHRHFPFPSTNHVQIVCLSFASIPRTSRPIYYSKTYSLRVFLEVICDVGKNEWNHL